MPCAYCKQFIDDVIGQDFDTSTYKDLGNISASLEFRKNYWASCASISQVL